MLLRGRSCRTCANQERIEEVQFLKSREERRVQCDAHMSAYNPCSVRTCPRKPSGTGQNAWKASVPS